MLSCDPALGHKPFSFLEIALEADKADDSAFQMGKSRDRIYGAVSAALAVALCAADECGFVSDADWFNGYMRTA